MPKRVLDDLDVMDIPALLNLLGEISQDLGAYQDVDAGVAAEMLRIEAVAKKATEAHETKEEVKRAIYNGPRVYHEVDASIPVANRATAPKLRDWPVVNTTAEYRVEEADLNKRNAAVDSNNLIIRGNKVKAKEDLIRAITKANNFLGEKEEELSPEKLNEPVVAPPGRVGEAIEAGYARVKADVLANPTNVHARIRLQYYSGVMTALERIGFFASRSPLATSVRLFSSMLEQDGLDWANRMAGPRPAEPLTLSQRFANIKPLGHILDMGTGETYTYRQYRWLLELGAPGFLKPNTVAAHDYGGIPQAIAQRFYRYKDTPNINYEEWFTNRRREMEREKYEQSLKSYQEDSARWKARREFFSALWLGRSLERTVIEDEVRTEFERKINAPPPPPESLEIRFSRIEHFEGPRRDSSDIGIGEPLRCFSARYGPPAVALMDKYEYAPVSLHLGSCKYGVLEHMNVGPLEWAGTAALWSTRCTIPGQLPPGYDDTAYFRRFRMKHLFVEYENDVQKYQQDLVAMGLLRTPIPIRELPLTTWMPSSIAPRHSVAYSHRAWHDLTKAVPSWGINAVMRPPIEGGPHYQTRRPPTAMELLGPPTVAGNPFGFHSNSWEFRTAIDDPDTPGEHPIIEGIDRIITDMAFGGSIPTFYVDDVIEDKAFIDEARAHYDNDVTRLDSLVMNILVDKDLIAATYEALAGMPRTREKKWKEIWSFQNNEMYQQYKNMVAEGPGFNLFHSVRGIDVSAIPFFPHGKAMELLDTLVGSTKGKFEELESNPGNVRVQGELIRIREESPATAREIDYRIRKEAGIKWMETLTFYEIPGALRDIDREFAEAEADLVVLNLIPVDSSLTAFEAAKRNAEHATHTHHFERLRILRDRIAAFHNNKETYDREHWDRVADEADDRYDTVMLNFHNAITPPPAVPKSVSDRVMELAKLPPTFCSYPPAYSSAGYVKSSCLYISEEFYRLSTVPRRCMWHDIALHVCSPNMRLGTVNWDRNIGGTDAQWNILETARWAKAENELDTIAHRELVEKRKAHLISYSSIADTRCRLLAKRRKALGENQTGESETFLGVVRVVQEMGGTSLMAEQVLKKMSDLPEAALNDPDVRSDMAALHMYLHGTDSGTVIVPSLFEDFEDEELLRRSTKRSVLSVPEPTMEIQRLLQYHHSVVEKMTQVHAEALERAETLVPLEEHRPEGNTRAEPFPDEIRQPGRGLMEIGGEDEPEIEPVPANLADEIMLHMPEPPAPHREANERRKELVKLKAAEIVKYVPEMFERKHTKRFSAIAAVQEEASFDQRGKAVSALLDSVYDGDWEVWDRPYKVGDETVAQIVQGTKVYDNSTDTWLSFSHAEVATALNEEVRKTREKEGRRAAFVHVQAELETLKKWKADPRGPFPWGEYYMVHHANEYNIRDMYDPLYDGSVEVQPLGHDYLPLRRTGIGKNTYEGDRPFFQHQEFLMMPAQAQADVAAGAAALVIPPRLHSPIPTDRHDGWGNIWIDRRDLEKFHRVTGAALKSVRPLQNSWLPTGIQHGGRLPSRVRPHLEKILAVYEATRVIKNQHALSEMARRGAEVQFLKRTRATPTHFQMNLSAEYFDKLGADKVITLARAAHEIKAPHSDRTALALTDGTEYPDVTAIERVAPDVPVSPVLRPHALHPHRPPSPDFEGLAHPHIPRSVSPPHLFERRTPSPPKIPSVFMGRHATGVRPTLPTLPTLPALPTSQADMMHLLSALHVLRASYIREVPDDVGDMLAVPETHRIAKYPLERDPVAMDYFDKEPHWQVNIGEAKGALKAISKVEEIPTPPSTPQLEGERGRDVHFVEPARDRPQRGVSKELYGPVASSSSSSIFASADDFFPEPAPPRKGRAFEGYGLPDLFGEMYYGGGARPAVREPHAMLEADDRDLPALRVKKKPSRRGLNLLEEALNTRVTRGG